MMIRTQPLAAAAVALTLVAWTASVVRADLVSGLIGQWRLDETGGLTAVDTIGTLDGSIEGSTTLGAAGVIGSAFSFDPTTSDRIQIGSSTTLIPSTDDFSIFAWVKIDTTPTSQTHIFSSNAGQAGRANLSVNTSGQLFWFQNGGVGEVAAPVNIVDGAYHLVGVTRDADAFTLHVDNQSFAIGSSAGAISQTTDWRIGSRASEDASFFDGSIDDVRVYSRALSDNDVRQMIYRAGDSADVLVADTLNGRVLRYHVEGTSWTQTGVFASSLSQPNGLAQDAAGNVYIGEQADGGRVLKYDRNGTFLGVVATEGVDYSLDNPRGIAFGPDGNLYVADRNGADGAAGVDTISVFDASTGSFLGFLQTVDNPQGLSWDPVNGRFLATVFGTPDIFSYDFDPAVSGVKILDNSLSGNFLDVEFIAGNVYFTDFNNDELRRIAGASTYTTVLGSAVLNGPGHLLALNFVPTPAALPLGLAMIAMCSARRTRRTAR